MGITSIRPAADACGAHHSRRVEEPRVVAQIPKVGIQYSLCFYKGHLGNVVIERPGHALPVVETIITEYDTDSLGLKLDEARETALGAVIVMLDKISGKVTYAVVSFGGFLGMGEDYYPLPWSNLKYDTNVGGYRVGITEDQLKGAPKYTRSTEWDWSDRARDREVYAYYKTPLWY